jgi:hypothetical protein
VVARCVPVTGSSRTISEGSDTSHPFLRLPDTGVSQQHRQLLQRRYATDGDRAQRCEPAERSVPSTDSPVETRSAKPALTRRPTRGLLFALPRVAAALGPSAANALTPGMLRHSRPECGRGASGVRGALESRLA